MPLLSFAASWVWLILGLVLIGLEILAPGVFMIWLGLAALGTGLADAWLDLPWQAAVALFAALSAVAVGGARVLTRSRGQEAERLPHLSHRGAALVGRRFTLDRPIANGEGRVRVNDSVWRVTGPDLPAGAAVRVVRLDGGTLVVEGVV